MRVPNCNPTLFENIYTKHFLIRSLIFPPSPLKTLSPPCWLQGGGRKPSAPPQAGFGRVDLWACGNHRRFFLSVFNSRWSEFKKMGKLIENNLPKYDFLDFSLKRSSEIHLIYQAFGAPKAWSLCRTRLSLAFLSPLKWYKQESIPMAASYPEALGAANEPLLSPHPAEDGSWITWIAGNGVHQHCSLSIICGQNNM